MVVAGAFRRVDSLPVEFRGVAGTAQFLKRLTAMEVGGAIVGVIADQRSKFGDGGFQIAVVGMIQSQTVADKRVLGILFQQGSQGVGSCTHASIFRFLSALTSLPPHEETSSSRAWATKLRPSLKIRIVN